MKLLFPAFFLFAVWRLDAQPRCSAMEAVTVKVQGSETGAGVLLLSDGRTAWIVTAKHLVPRGSKIFVVFSKNASAPVPASLELELAGGDAAVIKAVSGRGDLPKVAAHIRSEAIEKGERVSFVGHPAGQDWQCYLDKDVVSRLTYDQDDRLFLFSNPVVQKGASGGPVFDRLGSVLGLVTGQSPSGNTIAIRIDPVIRIMSDEVNVAISLPAERTNTVPAVQANTVCKQGCETKMSDLKRAQEYAPYNCYSSETSCFETVYEFPKDWPGGRFLHHVKALYGGKVIQEALNIANTDRAGDIDARGSLLNGVGSAILMKGGSGFTYKFYRAPGSESITIQLRPIN